MISSETAYYHQSIVFLNRFFSQREPSDDQWFLLVFKGFEQLLTLF